MPPARFFHPDYAPVYVPTLLSLAGTLFFLTAERPQLIALLTDRWALHYLLASPFVHGGLPHFLLNALALHFIGGQMLLPRLGGKRFVFLLAAGALAGHVVNNLMFNSFAVGLSAGIMALVGCALFPFGRAPMKLLLIHDLLRLPPFQFRHLAVFIVSLDIAGVVFGWSFFAHWAHLGGYCFGLLFGYLHFGRRLI